MWVENPKNEEEGKLRYNDGVSRVLVVATERGGTLFCHTAALPLVSKCH